MAADQPLLVVLDEAPRLLAGRPDFADLLSAECGVTIGRNPAASRSQRLGGVRHGADARSSGRAASTGRPGASRSRPAGCCCLMRWTSSARTSTGEAATSGFWEPSGWALAAGHASPAAPNSASTTPWTGCVEPATCALSGRTARRLPRIRCMRSRTRTWRSGSRCCARTPILSRAVKATPCSSESGNLELALWSRGGGSPDLSGEGPVRWFTCEDMV